MTDKRSSGGYIHLVKDDPPVMTEYKFTCIHQGVMVCAALRRVARAAEDYATALERGRQTEEARQRLSLAVQHLEEVNKNVRR